MKKAFKLVIMFFLVIFSVLIIISDRIFRIYRIDVEQPSLHDFKTLEFHRKDVLRRNRIRLLILLSLFIIYCFFQLINKLIYE